MWDILFPVAPFFLFSWPKIGRYLMSLGCPYYTNSEKKNRKKAAGTAKKQAERDPSNKDQAGRREGTTAQPQQQLEQSVRCHA